MHWQGVGTGYDNGLGPDGMKVGQRTGILPRCKAQRFLQFSYVELLG